jgi:hypothetical protein
MFNKIPKEIIKEKNKKQLEDSRKEYTEFIKHYKN